MHGFLKLDWQERLTGQMPEWCAGIEVEQHARWCFDPATILFTIGTTEITLGSVAMVASLAGAGMSAMGAVRTGQAQQQQAEQTAALQRQQAQIQLQQADRERQINQARESDFRRQQSALKARRRAVAGAAGVEFAAGSPLLVTEDFEAESELAALRVRSTGELRGTRLEQQAGLTQFAARQTQAAGAQAASAGFARGGALLLSGAGRAFGSV